MAVIGISLTTAVICARLTPRLAGRLRLAIAPLREVRPAREAGIPYRSQTISAPDPRLPILLAVAAQALLWLAVASVLRLQSVPLDVINLIDEPHQDLSLVPRDHSLVIAHVALGILAALTGLASLLGRRAIARLAAPGADPGRALRRSVAPSALLGLLLGTAAVAGLAALGVVTQTPMSLYWLDWMALQNGIYAAGCGLVGLIAAAAFVSARRWRTHLV